MISTTAIERAKAQHKGDCYRHAAMHGGDGDTVVHGYVLFAGPHAWLEREDGTITDWQTEHGVWFALGLGRQEYATTGWPAQEFLETFTPAGITRYTKVEAMVESVRARHWGPWEEVNPCFK